MINQPIDTLVLLVTCSMDTTRQDLAVSVVQNLAEKLPLAGLNNHFIMFDNASKFDGHIQYVPAGSLIIRSPENLGYWTAIKYVLENARHLMGREYKYIYIIESDLYHTDLCALSSCESFLEKYQNTACVRTQEFSVSQRWRFDKALKFLPFHVTRSEIRLQNLVTNIKAWFKKTDIPHLYRSNLHAKLPALNRFSAMVTVFDRLSKYDEFSEGDFFKEMFNLYPEIGIYDGGIFYSLFSFEDKKVMSGSYSTQEQLVKTGYQQTRYSKIIPVSHALEISRR